jgi:transcription elongation factor Elf1
MIIFGTKAKTQTLDEGDFYCPQCRMKRHYLRKQARPYFALYFIPLIPIGQGTEFVECQSCRTTFEPGVLAAKAPPPVVDLATRINMIRGRLAQGAPVEYVLRELTAAGLEFDVARATIDAQLGPRRRRCNACGLAYAPEVTVCSECGGALESVGG